MSYNLNSLKRGYIGAYIGELYRGYSLDRAHVKGEWRKTYGVSQN